MNGVNIAQKLRLWFISDDSGNLLYRMNRWWIVCVPWLSNMRVGLVLPA